MARYSRARTTRRAPARRTYARRPASRPAYARRGSGRVRRSGGQRGGQTVRLVIQTQAASPVAAPNLLPEGRAQPAKSKF